MEKGVSVGKVIGLTKEEIELQTIDSLVRLYMYTIRDTEFKKSVEVKLTELLKL